MTRLSIVSAMAALLLAAGLPTAAQAAYPGANGKVAYESYGTDCVEHLDGMFAFVLFDQRRRLLFGARDLGFVDHGGSFSGSSP